MKAKVHRTKPGRVDYNDLSVISLIEEACDAIGKSAEVPNVMAASKKFGIKYGTLRNRYLGFTKPTRQAHQHEQLISPEQETVLADWMKFLGMVGRPVTRATMKPKCVELCGRLPGRNWIWGFLKRHPELRLRKGSGLDPKRAQAFNYTTVNDHFEKLTKVIKENDIPWENVYNMDEKGIQLGGGRKGDGRKFFFSREDRGCYTIRSANLELVTVIESCCADGTAFKPGFVFSGKSVDIENIEVDDDICVATSENGWTSDTLCEQWFAKSFIPQAQARNTTGRKILLIFDGHGSHVTDNMIKLAIDNDIELFCLPPHTTHKLQPLDVGVFGPLQKAWVRQCDDYLLRTGVGMRKEHVIQEYMQARERSFSSNTITKAWEKCGVSWKEGSETRELKGKSVFTEADYAPSRNTSIHAEVPESYPKEFPSDFEPWPGAEPLQATKEIEEEEHIISQKEFEREWNSGKGKQLADESDDSMDEDDPDENELGDDSSDEDVQDDASQMDEDESDGDAARTGLGFASNDDAEQGSEQVVVSGQEATKSVDSMHVRVHQSEMTACDHMPSSHLGSSSTSTPTPSTPSGPANDSPPSVSPPFPQRSRDSEQSKRLDALLRPLPASSTKEEIAERAAALQAELLVVRKQRNQAEGHAMYAKTELTRLKTQANSRSKKKKGKVRISNAELLTGSEARERRNAELKEREAKEKKKETAKAAKAAKAAEAKARRAQIQCNPSHCFSGALSSKNKPQLEDILTALDLPVNGTKPDLIARVQDYFKYHPEEKTKPRFCGLFSRQPRRSNVAPPVANENIDPSLLHPPLPPPLQPEAGPSRSQPQALTSAHRYQPYPPPQITMPPPHVAHAAQFAPLSNHSHNLHLHTYNYYSPPTNNYNTTQ